jgi:hypothetical protein
MDDTKITISFTKTDPSADWWTVTVEGKGGRTWEVDIFASCLLNALGKSVTELEDQKMRSAAQDLLSAFTHLIDGQ